MKPGDFIVSKKMIVNFILPGLGDSGGIRVVHRYTKLLNQMGVDAVIYSPIWADNLHRYNSSLLNFVHQLYSTCKTLLTRNRTNKYVKWVPCICGCFIRKADFTIATTYTSAYRVVRLPEKCGEKCYFIQGYEVWESKEYGEKSYNLPLKKIVISSWINEQLKKNLGLGPYPVLYNGIDADVFSDGGEEKKNSKTTIMMMNHENPVKGVKEGLEVIRRIKEKRTDIHFIMFGMNASTDLPDYIEYYQKPDERLLVALYRRADIFLFPSLQDGWGLTPIEAMACGAVVVGTRTGFVLDLGDNRVNMMISSPGDIDSMVENTELLIDNPELRNRIREKAFETVKELSWEQSSERFVNLLRANE